MEYIAIILMGSVASILAYFIIMSDDTDWWTL